jgi:cyclic-di-GMP phosphodiesterase TipF (flagellum assembly factor)
MQVRSNLLFPFACGLVAAVVAMLLPQVLPVIDRGEAMGLAGFLFFTGALVAEMVQRRHADDLRDSAIIAMQRAATDMAADLEAARREVVRLREEMRAGENRLETRVTTELTGVKTLLTDVAAHLDPPAQRIGPPPAALPPQLTGFAPVNLPEPELTGAEAELIDIVRHALEENRVLLYLQPVVTLPQRKTRFYEAYSRLRADDGSIIGPDRYIPLAAQSGLISVIDNLLLFRCVNVIRKLRRRNRNIGFFCNISGFSLNDEAFFDQFVDFLAADADLAENLIFEFTAADVMRGGPAVDEKLSRLAAMGFRFSLDRVTSLDIDFAGLAQRRVRYLKVDTDVLLSPKSQAGASIDVADLKEALARAGIDLIAHKVETEREVVNLLEFGVDYGEGYLFGAPRPAKDDI